MSMMQEKMYMDVDDVCEILGVSKTYAYSQLSTSFLQYPFSYFPNRQDELEQPSNQHQQQFEQSDRKYS